MSNAKDQVIKDEADAERKYQGDQAAEGRARAGVKEEPVVMRVPKIGLSPLAAEAPSEITPYVQQALTDPEVKKLFEALIDEIRRQVAAGGGGGGEPGGGSVPASVITDLNNLRDNLILLRTSLDADAGVATDTFVSEGTPPPITTV